MCSSDLFPSHDKLVCIAFEVYFTIFIQSSIIIRRKVFCLKSFESLVGIVFGGIFYVDENFPFLL